MFTGAFLGLFVAYTANQTGLVQLNTSNFVAVGMAGALSGVLHAPLTAIFLIAEITGGYVLFIPLMVVASISYIIARLFNPHNMYWHDLIHENDIHPGQDYHMLSTLTLESLINRQYISLNGDMKVKDFFKLLTKSNANIFAVVNNKGGLEGVIWLDMIRKDMFDANISDDETIAHIMVVPPAIIDYNQSVNDVMGIFDKLDVWQLPVVKDGSFIGFVSKSTLLAKYREELIKQHHQSDLFLNA